MRSDFKKYSWTLWLVIIAFVGGFIVTDAFRGEEGGKRGLIYIGDKLIVRGEEYQRQLMRTLDNYKNQFKENFNKSLISQLRIPEQLLQNFINSAVVKEEADKLNIIATEKELKNKIINHPWFQQDGKFVGLRNYERFLGYYYKMTVPEFEELLKDQIISEKFQGLITGALVIDEETLRKEYKKEKDKAELDFILLKPDRIKEEIKIDDNDSALTEFYEKHKEDFKSPERRAGKVILYKFDDFKKGLSITPKEIYDSYMQKKSDFLIPEKVKVSRIFLKYDDKNREEVLKKAEALQKELTKENFAEKAKALSEDEKAKDGGDYGYYGWQKFTSPERSLIDSMDQNQISTPIDAQDGFSIVYISEKIPQKQQSFDEVKGRIKGSLEDEKVKQLVTNKLQKIYDKLAEVEDIKSKAGELGVTVVETELLTRGQSVKDLKDNGYISRKLFTLKEKEVAFPVQLMKGTAIVQLSAIEEPQAEPFEKVKEKVKKRVVLAKKIEALKQEAEKLSSEMNRTASALADKKMLESFLKMKDLSTEEVTYKRGNKLSYFPAQKGLDDLIFSLEENQFSSPIASKTEVAIVRVRSKTVTGPSDFEKDRTDFYDQKISELRNRYFSSYLATKIKAYQVSLNDELFQEIKDWVMTRYN